MDREDLIEKNLRGKRLKTLGKFINDHMKEFETEIVDGYCNTDRQISGTRLRHPGKGRYGNKLVVKDRRSKEVIFTHNAAETYRENREVIDWIIRNR